MSDVIWTIAMLSIICLAIVGVLAISLFVSWWSGQEPIDQGCRCRGYWHPSHKKGQ